MHIEIRGLSKSFDGTAVLNGLDYSGDVTSLAIIGPSGGGKSTFLRIVAGLSAPTSGEVVIDGRRVDYREKALPAHRARIGFVFQQGGLFQHMTAWDNITVPLRQVQGLSEDEASARAESLLKRFDLLAEANKRPAQLSGGQQQRVAIARAVAARPALLLLDEPTSALDPVYTNDVLDAVNDLKGDGVRFIIVTHEMGFARNACEQCAFLSGGKIQERGPSSELFAHPQTPELAAFLEKLLEWR